MDITMEVEEYSSSGCESGWTVYFEQSRGHNVYGDNNGCVNRFEHRSEDDEEEEEDLSMVSDASSGPAQVSQDTATNCHTNGDNWGFENGGGGLFYSVSGKRPPKRGGQARRGGKRPDDPQLLDDTASSSSSYCYSYSSSVNNDHHHRGSSMRRTTDFSQDHFSASYFQGGAPCASSTASETHYDQVQFHQQYHWY